MTDRLDPDVGAVESRVARLEAAIAALLLARQDDVPDIADAVVAAPRVRKRRITSRVDDAAKKAARMGLHRVGQGKGGLDVNLHWHDPNTGRYAPLGYVSAKILRGLVRGDGPSRTEFLKEVAKKAEPGDPARWAHRMLGPRPSHAGQERNEWDAGYRELRAWRAANPTAVGTEYRRPTPQPARPVKPDTTVETVEGVIDGDMSAEAVDRKAILDDIRRALIPNLGEDDDPFADETAVPAERPPLPAERIPLPDVYNGGEGWTRTGEQGGSNPGARYKRDSDGASFYVKETRSPDHAVNELVANRLYEMAGVPVPETHRGEGDDTLFASRILPGEELNGHLDKANAEEIKARIRDDFVVDAWLGNWDVVGMVNDNILIGEDGVPYRIDAGGALAYRAQGGPKGAAWGPEVGELDTMRGFGPIPPNAGTRLFSGTTESQMRAGAEKVASIHPDEIRRLIRDLGGDPDLAETLIARRADIIDKLLDGDDPHDDPFTDASAVPQDVDEPEDDIGWLNSLPVGRDEPDEPDTPPFHPYTLTVPPADATARLRDDHTQLRAVATKQLEENARDIGPSLPLESVRQWLALPDEKRGVSSLSPPVRTDLPDGALLVPNPGAILTGDVGIDDPEVAAQYDLYAVTFPGNGPMSLIAWPKDRTPPPALLDGTGGGKFGTPGFDAALQRAAAWMLMRAWNQSSTLGAGGAIQLAAVRRFGGELKYRIEGGTDGGVPDDIVDAFVEAVYQRTQAHLAELGITELALYRGTRLPGEDPLERIEDTAGMNVLSSWTLRPSTAVGFARGVDPEPHPRAAVVVATVPAERVFSTGQTGLGVVGEWEAVVLGDPPIPALVVPYAEWSAVKKVGDPDATRAAQDALGDQLHAEWSRRAIRRTGIPEDDGRFAEPFTEEQLAELYDIFGDAPDDPFADPTAVAQATEPKRLPFLQHPLDSEDPARTRHGFAAMYDELYRRLDALGVEVAEGVDEDLLPHVVGAMELGRRMAASDGWDGIVADLDDHDSTAAAALFRQPHIVGDASYIGVSEDPSPAVLAVAAFLNYQLNTAGVYPPEVADRVSAAVVDGRATLDGLAEAVGVPAPELVAQAVAHHAQHEWGEYPGEQQGRIGWELHAAVRDLVGAPFDDEFSERRHRGLEPHPAIRAYVAERVAQTRERLAEAGLGLDDTVRLARGYIERDPDRVDETMGFGEFRLTPLSAWTARLRVADAFAGSFEDDPDSPNGVVLVADVPVRQLFSTSDDGFGLHEEFEAVVMGPTVDGWARPPRDPSGWEPPDDAGDAIYERWQGDGDPDVDPFADPDAVRSDTGPRLIPAEDLNGETHGAVERFDSLGIPLPRRSGDYSLQKIVGAVDVGRRLADTEAVQAAVADGDIGREFYGTVWHNAEIEKVGLNLDADYSTTLDQLAVRQALREIETQIPPVVRSDVAALIDDGVLSSLDDLAALFGMSKEELVGRAVAARLQDAWSSWQGGSSDQLGFALHAAVARAFGLPSPPNDEIAGRDISEWLEGDGDDPGVDPVLVAWAHARYQATQDRLAELGYGPDDEVKVWRGMVVPRQSPLLRGGTVTMNPLSSWSVNLGEAAVFADPNVSSDVDDPEGIVLEGRVKARDIFSFGEDGFGSSREQEVVVLGREPMAVNLLDASGDHYEPPVTYDDSMFDRLDGLPPRAELESSNVDPFDDYDAVDARSVFAVSRTGRDTDRVPLSDEQRERFTTGTESAADAVTRLLSPALASMLGEVRIRAATDAKFGRGRHGLYSPGTRSVVVNADSSQIEFATAHEIGHAIDHMLGGDGRFGEGGFASNVGLPDPEVAEVDPTDLTMRDTLTVARSLFGAPTDEVGEAFGEFIDAVMGTPQIQTIAEYADAGNGHAKYLFRRHEMWARAFAQWVASRTGGRMQRQLRHDQRLAQGGALYGQWDDDTFEETVAPAVEGVLRAAGLLDGVSPVPIPMHPRYADTDPFADASSVAHATGEADRVGVAVDRQIPAGVTESMGVREFFFGDMEWESFSERGDDASARVGAAMADWTWWKGNYRMRHASAALMGLPVPHAAHGGEVDETEQALLRGGPLADADDRARTNVRVAVEQAADLLDAIRWNAPSEASAYRGMPVWPGDPVLGLEEGDEIVMPLTAFTPDKGTADGFAAGLGDTSAGWDDTAVPVVFELIPGAHAVDDLAPNLGTVGETPSADAIEWVTAGRFRVVAVHPPSDPGGRVTGPREFRPLRIVLQQTAVFEPSFMGRWHELDLTDDDPFADPDAVSQATDGSVRVVTEVPDGFTTDATDAVSAVGEGVLAVGGVAG